MKIKLLTALLALLACTSVAQAQTYFDWSGYTYRWKGNDVSVKQTVTDPGQMVELRNKLMQDTLVPGTIEVDKGGIYHHQVSYKDGSNDYTPKKKDGTLNEGFTCLLYTLKDGVNKETTPKEPKTREEFEKTVESITLLTNTTECEEAYISTFTGYYDRFYFASKGKPRWDIVINSNPTQYFNYPCDWELYSPTGNASNLSDEDFDRTPNFLEILTAGGVYKISHDCSNVGGQKHYFSVNPAGSPPHMTNVALVVPKNRMLDWSKNVGWPDGGTCRDHNGLFTWYNPDYSPRLAIYKADLTVSCKKSGTFDQYTDEGRMFDVTLNWNSTLRDPQILNWPGQETCVLYRIEDDGEEVELTSGQNLYNFNYMVEQRTEPYELKYKVVCYPTGTNPNDPVQATTLPVTVKIPGYRGILTDFSYRSRFIKSEGLNSYKNTITLYPEKETTSFRIYRKPVAIKKTSSFDDTQKIIAEVILRTQGSGVEWAINPYNQIDEQDDNRFDYEQWHDWGTIYGHPDEFIEVFDYFTEKTVADPTKRASEYIYLISQKRVNGEWSTPVEIGTAPVYSGNLKANYNVYCDQDVYYDDDMSTCDPSKLHGLKIQDLETNQTKYADVSSYDIYVGNYIGFSGVKQVTAAGDNEIQGAPGTFYAGQLSVNSSYGLNTYGTNEVKKLNTNITINSKKGTSAPFDNNNNIYGALVKFAGVTDKDIAPYVLGYNVKREVQGENPVFLRKLENKQFADGWNSDYSAIKADYPTGNTTNPVLFNDIFTGDEQTNGETYYDIRMYSTDAPMEDYDQQSDVYVTDIRIVVEHEHSSAPIPGKYDFGYRSRFIKDAGVNSYKNIIDFTTESTVEEYKFYRKPVSLNQSSTFNETPILIADVKWTQAKNSWIYNSHNQLEGFDANRFDRIVVQTIKEDKNAAFTIADYFTEEPISDESARAAAYVYLISKSVNGVWTEPEEIGVAPVYSGKITDPVYSPSYSYIQIKMDMKKMSNDDTRLAPTDHATIEIEHYQNDYISQTERNKATYGFYRDSELAYNGLTSSSIDIKLYEDNNSTGKEFDGGVYTGQISVNSKWGLNTYGTSPRALDQIDCEVSSPEPESEEDQLNHGWQWFGDPEGEEKAFFVNLFIKPKMYRPLLNIRLAHPYVYYYSVTKDSDTDESTFVLLNNMEDLSGHGWASNIAPIKKTYPIGTSYNQTTEVNEIWVDKDYSGSDVCLQLGYNVRMYYTPTYTTGTPSKTQKFYIVDNSCIFDLVEFHTGVNDVNVDKSVVDVKYYNLMGVCSDKPFDGANIKVERHADGTTTSTKMMK